jgi:hypothetical protein
MHNNPPHGMLNLTTLLDAYQMMVTARTMSDTNCDRTSITILRLAKCLLPR